jgi:hypothetical protein
MRLSSAVTSCGCGMEMRARPEGPWSGMNCTAIELISAHSRASGNPGPRTRPKSWVRFRGDERNQELISL